MPLSQLLYVSTAREGLGFDEIVRILDTSRRKNERDELSGMLLFTGAHFLQVIEGRRGALEALYERLTQDPRHHDLRVLDLRRIDARRFGDWRMGYLRLGSEARRSRELRDYFARPYELDAAEALDVLHDLAGEL